MCCKSVERLRHAHPGTGEVTPHAATSICQVPCHVTLPEVVTLATGVSSAMCLPLLHGLDARYFVLGAVLLYCGVAAAVPFRQSGSRPSLAFAVLK